MSAPASAAEVPAAEYKLFVREDSARFYLRDGKLLSVLSASKWGGSDAERSIEYARFLTDFHRVIPDDVRKITRFRTGVGKAQHVGLTIVVVIVALFFVALPLGLAVYLRELEPLLIAGAGFGFLWPVYRMAEAANPAEYDPRSVPLDFYP